MSTISVKKIERNRSKTAGLVVSTQQAERHRFYLVMLSRWARSMVHPPRSLSNIAKLLDRMTVLPSVRRAYEREGITDEIC
jgi:hypothetical protein